MFVITIMCLIISGLTGYGLCLLTFGEELRKFKKDIDAHGSAIEEFRQKLWKYRG